MNDSKLTLLLVFKDNLPKGEKQGFPLTIGSESITKHIEMIFSQEGDVEISENPEYQTYLFDNFPKSSIKIVNVNDIPEKTFVWGWWRKAGEQHFTLLNYIKEQCDQHGHINTLLLNNYLRRVYQAKIKDIYYVPYANTVEIPPQWIHRCPDYYRENPHFCGCFFLMEIPGYSENNSSNVKYNTPAEIFKDYYIDEISFDPDYLNKAGVISPPEDSVNICRNMIETSPSIHLIKSSDQTMFALRNIPQINLAINVYNSDSTDIEISQIFSKLSSANLRKVLMDFSYSEWIKLFKLPATLQTISNEFISENNNISKKDIFLVSWILANDINLDSLFSHDNNGNREINECGKTLINWLLSEDITIQRKNASKLFIIIWKFISEKWSLLDISTYFEKLPEFEEVAFSTKHGFDNKFYRDHLNHNIRAAMLSSYLIELNNYRKDEKYNELLIAFLSGLLHDFAHPLSSYENTVNSLQKALDALKITLTSRVGSLVDRNKLKNSINIVALISSLPNIDTAELYSPIINRDDFLEEIDPGILFDEMLCSMSDEHALLSAAVLFNCAAEKKGNGSFNTGVRKIFQDTESNRELFSLIQCIALHDRKAASHYNEIGEEHPNVPVALSFDRFKIPCITFIADELQEWGRPIAKYDKTIVKDANFSFSDNTYTIYFLIDIKNDAIDNTPYSFIEHFFSKVRSLPKISISETNIKIKMNIDILNGVKVSYLGKLGALIGLDRDSRIIKWPYHATSPAELIIHENQGIICIASPNTHPSKYTINSIIFLDNISSEEQKNLLSGLQEDTDIISFEYDNEVIIIKTSDGTIITQEISEYYYCKLSSDTAFDTVFNMDNSNNLSILRAKLISVESTSESLPKNRVKRDLYIKPYSHFLDLDWRFSWNSINSILNFVLHHGEDGSICYLGCPSLAIYHNLLYKNKNTNWKLLDKGHYALDDWIKKEYIPEKNYLQYDVKDPVLKEYLNSFDILVMDPPWYTDYYEVFWNRALSLIKQNGIIGLSEYPGYKDKKEKLKHFEKTREIRIQSIAGKDYYCSLEISYIEPQFELTTGIQKEFTHAALNAYRPAYMDFYQILKPSSINSEFNDDHFEYEINLSEIANLDNGHYLRYLSNIDYKNTSENGIIVETRDVLDRIKKDDGRNIIGWTTNNTIVKYAIDDSDQKPTNYNELLDFIMQYEANL